MNQTSTGRKKPAYMDVYSDLRAKMKVGGTYPIGAFLPTEGELEKIYNVSRTTIRHAIRMLSEDGLIRVTQGRGTEVISDSGFIKYANVKSVGVSIGEESLNTRNNKNFVVTQIGIDTVYAREKTASLLGVEPGDPLYRLQRLLTTTDGKPVALIIDMLSPKLVPDLPKYAYKFLDLYSFLEETYNIKYLRSEERITAKAATLLEANTLNVETGSPLLYCRRVAYCEQGPLEYAYTTYVSDLYSIIIDMDVRDYALY